MDKTLFYPREKLSSTDLNQVVNNVESYCEDIITKLIYGESSLLSPTVSFGFDGYVRGLIATAGDAPNYNSVLISEGLAYTKNGKKILVPSDLVLYWDNSPNGGKYAHITNDRIDVIVLAHQYQSVVESRPLIDTNPASPTFGQLINSSVVVAQNDYYTIAIIQGEPDPIDPQIPPIPYGTIPIAYVYISSFTNNGNHDIFIKADASALPDPHSHLGSAWNPEITSDVDTLLYTKGLRWFHNGCFYSEGTTSATGDIHSVEVQYKEIYNFDLLVNTSGNVWQKVNSINFDPVTKVITSNTGFNNKPYRLTVKGK